MVNIGKRMRKLKPLLSIRSGHGAALLPPPSPSQPQLTHIHLTFPCGPFDTPIHGARLFWRNHLRRLKYHNPALSISVEHGPGHLGSPMMLRLDFEGTDPEALRRVAERSAKVKAPFRRKADAPRKVKEKDTSEMLEAEREDQARLQSPNWRDAPGRAAMKAEDEHSNEIDAQKTEPPIPTADDDEVVLKDPQPPASSEKLPIYTRSCTLGIKDRTAGQIWNWFQHRTRCLAVERSEEDRKEYVELKAVFSQSEEDRLRVKKGIDEMKASKQMLARAKGEAEKLKAEA